jgi:hypothetical protein
MRKEKKFLPINLAIYRLHVIITWERSADKIIAYAKAHNCVTAKSFKTDFEEHLKEDVLGLCMVFSNDNPDVLVWLAEQPTRASNYGTLYHELYHAVDSIEDSRNLSEEAESRAYIFEYLVTEANKVLWAR